MAPAILARRPRILYLDAYDSFSNNIIALVEHCIDADVVKCHIDDGPVFLGYERLLRFVEYLKEFDAVIAGPGPGWAKCDKDVGLMKELWTLQDTHMLPVLGICLGFQSMCLAFGADIERLVEPRHGLVSEILHRGRSIFAGVEEMLATQYHSLQVMIGHSIQTKKAVRYPAELWEATKTCPQLEPLAWDFDCRRNGAVLMAAKHSDKPFWGVQFHPESICTNSEGTHIIQNWWHDVQLWAHKRGSSHVLGKNSLSSSSDGSIAIEALRYPLDSSELKRESRERRSLAEMAQDIPPISRLLKSAKFKGDQLLHVEELASLIAYGDQKSLPNLPPTMVHCGTTGSGRLTVADIVEVLDIPRYEAIILESGLQRNLLPMAVGTGRYSIIGLVIPGETLRLHYYTGSRLMQLRNGMDEVHSEWRVSDPWKYIRGVMVYLQRMMRRPPTTPTWAPFWGGLMGYASYEAGLETIDVQSGQDAAYPDVCFAYVTRTIVIDHQLKKIYAQSIRGPDDEHWVNRALDKIYEAAGRKSLESTPNSTPMPKLNNPFEQDATFNNYLASCKQYVADQEEYCASVASCQAHIADGQSYEICLTTTNEIRARRPRICRLSKFDNNELSWKLYKGLASQNPAPFSAYMRLHNIHIVSSSPERYISWDRMQTAQCRPIKGTVAKKPGITAADAHAILSSPKERAENLMIVDLVRHQLHGVYGSGNVNVRQLMEVEEYETLWQLVSVVDAVPRDARKPRTPDEWEEPPNYVSASKSPLPSEVAYLGFDAFVESLPPGSMTGAPKKRSCELLQREEPNRRRGIYSGVLGYLDVGGGGDFSVVIRTAVKIDEPSSSASSNTTSQEDVWQIGAGGAITSQSVPDAEYEEMLGKFQSTARAFTADVGPATAGSEGAGAAAKLSSLFTDGHSVVPEIEGLERLESEIRRLGFQRFGMQD